MYLSKISFQGTNQQVQRTPLHPQYTAYSKVVHFDKANNEGMVSLYARDHKNNDIIIGDHYKLVYSHSTPWNSDDKGNAVPYGIAETNQEVWPSK